MSFETILENFIDSLPNLRKDLLSSLTEEFYSLFQKLEFYPDSLAYDLNEGTINSYFYYKNYEFKIVYFKYLDSENNISTSEYNLIVSGREEKEPVFNESFKDLNSFISKDFLRLASAFILNPK